MVERSVHEEPREVHVPAAGVAFYGMSSSERVEAARRQAAESYRAEVRQLDQMRLFDEEDEAS